MGCSFFMPEGGGFMQEEVENKTVTLIVNREIIRHGVIF